MHEGFTYREAGVDVAAGNEAVRLLKQRLKSTRHPLVLEGIGGFGGVMRLPPLRDAVLVAGTDGVGTKVMLAQQLARYDTVGIDLVAMSANDVSACGAVPLFFLDYLVVGKLVPEQVADLVAGVDEGCLRAQCVLLGGETAEHPGHFAPGDFDMAGFCVGLASRDELWGPAKVREGDVVVGLDSTGVHSNGFSLVRRLLEQHGIGLGEEFPGAAGGRTVGDVLLTPTAIYSAALHDLGHACEVHAAAHITGGGFPDNVGRAVPDGLAAILDLASWTPPPVFAWLASLGVGHDELLRTFNCGVGMAVVLPPDQQLAALDVLQRGGHEARVVGRVSARGPDGEAVSYEGRLRL
jgi:phosphoribosylformylglycinamidine cyclo-ligase